MALQLQYHLVTPSPCHMGKDFKMREAVIVSAARTAIGKAPRGALRNVHTADLAATAIKAALERAPGLDLKQIDDVILGCAMPEAEQGLNMARVATLRAGLPND